MVFTFMSEEEAAESLLGHYKLGGPTPGGFATQLIMAFEKADPMNLERLLKGFPEFRKPVLTLQLQGGEGLKQKLAGGEFK